jgi:hypothetical protein
MIDELGVPISPPAVAELGAFFQSTEFIDTGQASRALSPRKVGTYSFCAVTRKMKTGCRRTWRGLESITPG